MKHTKLALALMLTIIAMHTRSQNQKPNIILILADDVGYKSLTCNGGNLYSTPNIDALAKKGMRFTQCYASPTCSPSRFLLLTGKYNFRNYCEWGKMDIDQKTIGNMMKHAGYKTGFFGKDQLQGGEQSLSAWGFDAYCVHDPLKRSIAGNRYKNPHIYTHGDFLPDSATLNKYGPDIISDSLFNFINKNKSVPFFIYYPMILVHEPMSPTPDDKEFADWDPKNRDTAYFPAMMHYMDKKIGELIIRLKNSGIEKNTVIIFSGDNGTPGKVADYSDDDSVISGGKKATTTAGTHVPLIVYWPGTVNAGTINNDLIDFTDILPTLAGITEIPVPINFGKLDGVSFAPRLKLKSGTPRKWIFNSYTQHPKTDTLIRWAQTKRYKLYDTSSSTKVRRFYEIENDMNERHPLADTALSATEITIKQQLLDVINYYTAQGTPVISLNPSIFLITDSSFVLRDTIRVNGGSTVTASGAVWSTSPDPKISSSSHTSTGSILGAFSILANGLEENTTYYVKAYATNFAGTAYSKQVIIKTPLKVPVATTATGIDSNEFTANWNEYAGAKDYRLDVSTSPTFTKIISDTITEGFDSGLVLPAGWNIKGGITVNASSFGKASPSLMFTTSKARIITDELNGPASQLKFWMKGLNAGLSSLEVEGFTGDEWITMVTLSNFSQSGTIKIFDANSNPPLPQNFIRFRFTYTRNGGGLVLDDISIQDERAALCFVPMYHNRLVITNSKTVNGLDPATKYYYRIRAETVDNSTGNSNVITVATKDTTPRFHITKRRAGTDVNSSSAVTGNNNYHINVIPNPSSAEFTLTLKAIKNEKTEITVTDIYGKVLYRAAGSGNRYKFGKTFAPGEYFVRVTCGVVNRTIKIVKAN